MGLCWIIVLRLMPWLKTSFFMGLLMTYYIQWERKRLFGAKRELGGTMFLNKACTLYKGLLGMSGVLHVQSKLRCSKFSQMEDGCPQNINKSSWFSGLGAGLSPWSQGSNPCCIHDLFGLTVVALLSSSWTHNILYSKLLEGICQISM
jgi:hypothetical protein